MGEKGPAMAYTNSELDRRGFMKGIGGIAGAFAFSTALSRTATAEEAADKGKLVFDVDQRLFQPTHIGSLEIRNMFIRSAMHDNRCDLDGSPTDSLIEFLLDDANGGIGMIVNGAAKLEPAGDGGAAIYDESQVPAWKKLTDAIHGVGAKFCMQLVPLGPAPDVFNPNILTREDMLDIIDKAVKSSLLSIEAGCDAIELHFAHGYLMSSFLAHYSNERADEYGGDVEGRARFPFELFEAVREAVGPDFPLIVKVESDMHKVGEGGSLDDTLYIVQGLVDRGVDAIDCSGKGLIPTQIDSREDQNVFSRDARTIAASISVPMILNGALRSVDMLSEALRYNDQIVGFAMGRAVLSEPDLPNKWAEDPSYTPRCISCNWCMQNLFGDPSSTESNVGNGQFKDSNDFGMIGKQVCRFATDRAISA